MEEIVIEKAELGAKSAIEKEESMVPMFEEITPHKMTGNKVEMRKYFVPPNRITALKANWDKIVKPIVEQLKLQIRYNKIDHTVEMRTSPATTMTSALQKACDFVEAFMIGFELDDCIALIRLDDIYTESFMIEDVKDLKGDHLSRAIGRIAGLGGKTKFTIENSTKTRIVLADHKVHILGTYQNIAMARNSICNLSSNSLGRLILGAPPGKVHNQMKNVASRLKERF